MDKDEQRQLDSFQEELIRLLSIQKQPNVPQKLEILRLDALPDLTEWRNR